MVRLPPPRREGPLPVERALDGRRSLRDYADRSLGLAAVSQLLWAAQGVTGERGYRSAPSAGALYPLVACLVAGDVEGLGPGVYRYEPDGHGLVPLAAGDRRGDLAAAALGQPWVAGAPAVVGIAVVYARTARRYGERGVRYALLEAGHAAQNVHLQAEALGLGSVAVGAFDDERVKRVLALPVEAEPVYLIPVGAR